VVLLVAIGLPGAVDDFQQWVRPNDQDAFQVMFALHWSTFTLRLLSLWLLWGVGRLVLPVARRWVPLVPWGKVAGAVLASLLFVGGIVAKLGEHATSLGRRAAPAVEHVAPSVERERWTPRVTVPLVVRPEKPKCPNSAAFYVTDCTY
jgi:hypothetical protein